MVKRDLKQIDLLRKRREAINLASPYFIETKRYIKKGVFGGLIVIASSLIIGFSFIFRIKILENKKNQIKIYSDEYDLLEKKLKDEQKQIDLVSNFNKTLKDSILNISSSSALFKEIALIIPKDIQLLSLDTKDNSLILNAKLPKYKYLEILNSFLINLDKSELVKFDDIDLIEIKSIYSNSTDEEYLVKINTQVSNNYKNINEKYLIKLGSYGLFNRLNILKNIEKSIDKTKI
tara:strand:- start:686 stop:1387 length:702 start_codon:yes stop_codon:yes gene_type:complete